MKLNIKAYKNALKLVKAGKIIDDDQWEPPSSELENEIIEKDGWDEFSKWHLGIREDTTEETKGRYAYPYSSDFENVSRRGIIAVKTRSAQQGHEDVYKAASRLLEAIDKVLEIDNKIKNVQFGINIKNDKIEIEGIAYTDEVKNLNGVQIPTKEIDFSYYDTIGKPLIHNHNTEKVIGKVEEIQREKGKIKIKGWIARWYHDVWEAVVNGVLRGLSIGVTRLGGKWILTEISLTPTPAVPVAVFDTYSEVILNVGGSIESQKDTKNMNNEVVFENTEKEGVVIENQNHEVSDMNVKLDISTNQNTSLNSSHTFATININWGDVKQTIRDVTQQPNILSFLGVEKMTTPAEYVSLFANFGNVYGEDNAAPQNITKSDIVLISRYFYSGVNVKPSELIGMDTEKMKVKVGYLTKSLLFGVENAIIKGDSAGSSQPLSYWDGLLKLGNANKENITGPLTLSKFKSILKKLGSFGANTNDLVVIVDVTGFDQITEISEVVTVDKFGSDAYIKTGAVAAILGIPVYVSPVSLTTTSGSTTKTNIIVVNKTTVKVGQYQNIETKQIETQNGTTAIIVYGFYGFAGLSSGIAIGEVNI